MRADGPLKTSRLKRRSPAAAVSLSGHGRSDTRAVYKV